MNFLVDRSRAELRAVDKPRFWTVVLALGMFVLGAMLPTSAVADQASQPALLIIDVQQFYYPEGAMPLVNPEAAGANIKQILEKWRAENRLVIHVGHKAGQGMDFHADVAPLDGEKVIIKTEVCSFKGTELLKYLQDREITTLVICGMQTHMCVEAAVRAAADLDFSCILVHDACATRDIKYGEKVVAAADVHAATLGTISGVYAEVIDTETALARKDY